MMLRLAYFVFVHTIPPELVINADHTGIMFTQHKGTMWITKEMADAKDKSVQGNSGKRQFTLLATTSAAGETLPHQVVFAGKTSASLPKYRSHYTTTLSGLSGAKQLTLSVCFKMAMLVSSVANISSFRVTTNHWSDNVTSQAYVMDVVVPYFKKKITAMRHINPSSCKMFGVQICVLILDIWRGWIDPNFKKWLAT